MKKVLLFLLSICVLTPAFADERDRAIIAASSDDRVQLEVLSRVGYGFHIVKTDAFKRKVSGEFFFNVLQLDAFPIPNLGLSLGVDCAFNRFTANGAEFYLDADRKIQAINLSDVHMPYGAKLTGGFKNFSLSAPLMVRGLFGDFKVSVGAELDVNFPATAYYTYYIENRTTRVSENKGSLNRVSAAVVASATFCDMGFFVKFYPKFAPMLPSGSVPMSYWTVGFIYGM